MLTQKTPRKLTFLTLALAALAFGVLVATGALAKPVQVSVLGNTPRNPPPDCGSKYGRCGVFGKVTAIQVKANGKQQPFKVRRSGKIVAFSVDVGKPTKSERQVLGSNDYFGNPRRGGKATARLAVLKRLTHRKRRVFQLRRQSPTVEIPKRAYGSRYFFTLSRPMKVAAGRYVGITVPTWLPAIQSKFGSDDVPGVPPGFKAANNEWIASRPADKCEGTDNTLSAVPQQSVGKKRVYGCKFTLGRILYHVYYKRNPKK